MRITTGVFNRAARAACIESGIAATATRPKRMSWRAVLLLAALGGGVEVSSIAAPDIQYAGHSGAHNLYVLNPDGNLFRWGEPRYGPFASTPSPALAPYFETMIAVPPSPYGARWRQAAGMNSRELFLDEAGHVFVNQLSLTAPTAFIELLHPTGYRKWWQIANGESGAALIDDTGELYDLVFEGLLLHVASHPGEPLPSPNPWLTHIPRPGAFNAILEVKVPYGATLVRTAMGEIYGRSYGNWSLTGSEPVEGGSWQRVVRPQGVGAWRSFAASSSSAVAVGDDGNAYYWGQRIWGTTAADPLADSRIPALIDRPEGVTGWRSVAVTGTLVLLISDAGGVYGFGYHYSGLPEPIRPPGVELMQAATPAAHPLLQGAFDSIQCGSDYVIARKQDGTDVRWGQFMRLDSAWFPGEQPPGVVTLPPSITDLPDRRSPAARILNPGNFNRMPPGRPVQLSAEVFPLEGSLASVQFFINDAPLAGIPQVAGHLATLAWESPAPQDPRFKVGVTDSTGRVTISPEISFHIRHSVEWTLSTNRIHEPAAGELGAFAEVQLTRTELPYPNYHAFSYQFRLAPLSLLHQDFELTGATPVNDGSGSWEVSFAPGQKTATVRITALDDLFTEPVLNLHLAPSHDWATAQDYIPPESALSLDIIDATSTSGPSPVFIVDRLETRFSFVGGTVPVTVSVPKSLAERPDVQLHSVNFLFPILISIEDLSDRWLYHFTVGNLPPGLHDVTARVRDGSFPGFDRYRDSAPVALRVWDTAGLANVRVVAADQVVNEADEPSISLAVMRDGSLDDAVDVELAVSGIALAGSDYDALPNVVTIPAGARYAQVTLQFHDDARPELDEFVFITTKQHPCEQLEGCRVADVSSVFRVTIHDDDGTEPAEGGARVVASPFSEASYLITASGQVYAWGANPNGQLGLGALPPELTGQVPWPRRLRGLAEGEKWTRLFPGPSQAFGLTDQGNLYVWGAGFMGAYYGSYGIPQPRITTGLPPDAEPVYPLLVQGGTLMVRQASGRLQHFGMTSSQAHQLFPVGVPGLVALLATPQRRVLSDDGYFHDGFYDWQGLYAERYPLAPGAGYWKDVASSGDRLVAVDELGRLFNVIPGSIQYDPALGRSRMFYTTEALPALPAGRSVSRLLGNDLGILALATDGAAFMLAPAANGQPTGPGSLIAFPEGVTRWTSLAAGQTHFLAVGDDGRVYSWGSNAMGQLGDGTTEPVDSPQAVPVFASVNDPTIEFPVINLARPPLASFQDMETEYWLGGPETILAQAQAYDPDGLIERVEFLLNGEVAAVAAFDFELMAFVAEVYVPHPGVYLLTARAWDDAGLSGDSTGIPVHVDDPGLYPIVKVWNIPSGTAEGYGFPGYFIISRQGIADVPLTVYFDIEGTATEGTDYPALPRSVVIPAGAAEVRLPVIARPDFVDEDTEDVNLTILNPGCDPDTAEPGSGCYRIAIPETAPVFILDYLRPGDAFLPFVSMRLLNSPIIREGTTNVAQIEVRRYGVFVEDLPVAYSLAGTAENGVDYLPLSGVAVIPAGADRTTINLAAIEDFVAEPFERVFVTLENPGCDTSTGSIEGCYLSDQSNSIIIYVGERPVPPPPPPGLNTVPRPVFFDSIDYFAGEGAILSVMSDPGATFVLETSADLVHWHPLGSLTSENGRVEFFDVDGTSTGTRFYRLAPPPDH